MKNEPISTVVEENTQEVQVERQLQIDEVWSEFKKISDFIIQNRKQRRERLAKE